MREAIKLAIEWIEKQPEEITASKYDVNSRYVVLRELEAALAQAETPYKIGQRIAKTGGGISHLWSAVSQDDEIAEAERGFKEALAQPEQCEYPRCACDNKESCKQKAQPEQWGASAVTHPEYVAEQKRKTEELRSILTQPEPKYRRGNRLICLETEEYCVIHISGTDRQWVKFPDSHIGVYTNEQVAELFDLLPKEPEQEPVAWRFTGIAGLKRYMTQKQYDAQTPETKKWYEPFRCANCITPPQRTWVGLTEDEIRGISLASGESLFSAIMFTHDKLKQKNGYAEEKNT